jgi:hypothetical protein
MLSLTIHLTQMYRHHVAQNDDYACSLIANYVLDEDTPSDFGNGF